MATKVPLTTEYHWVVKFSVEQGQFIIDFPTAEDNFPDGTVWDEATQEWRHLTEDELYEADGVYHGTTETLKQVVTLMNGMLDAIKVSK